MQAIICNIREIIYRISGHRRKNCIDAVDEPRSKHQQISPITTTYAAKADLIIQVGLRCVQTLYCNR